MWTKPKLNVLIVGLDYSGKTTLLEKVKSKFGKLPSIPPEKIPPTIGMNLAKLQYAGHEVIIWDLGGQIKMRNIWENYYDDANAIIFVVDSTDIMRLEEAKLAYGEIF
jgi:ADP-ribosylation factor related protein 1